MNFPVIVQGAYVWLKGLKYPIKIYKNGKSETSMSLNKSALFFLASVAMEETKTIYKRKIY